MSDDLDARGHHAITHNGETYIKLADAAVTFKRLKAWRVVVNDALTNWLNPILDNETPKDALRRLIRHEITAALDPAVSQDAADLVATARRHALEDAAKIADDIARKDHITFNIGYAIRAAAQEKKGEEKDA